MKNKEIKLENTKANLKKAYDILSNCTLCPRNCKVNRLANEKGYCKSGKELYISSFGPHFGEEDVLVGKFGSGTIFFTGCNLGCVYCQNYTLSHLHEGYKVSEIDLSNIMLSLQERGCHNINLVSPTHFIPQIMQALYYSLEKGLNIPIVFNCGGYESRTTLHLLNGIVDIYMPDMKYANSIAAKQFSNTEDYFKVAKIALKEMYSQVGDLFLDEFDVAYKGLLIRHLVLPNKLANSAEIFKFISSEISKNTYINIIDQYRPLYNAMEYVELSRIASKNEHEEVVEMAKLYGLHNLL